MAVASDLPALEQPPAASSTRRTRCSTTSAAAARRPASQPEPDHRQPDQIAPYDASTRSSRSRTSASTRTPASTCAASARAFVQDVVQQRRARRAARRSPSSSSRTRSQAQCNRTVFEKLREAALAYHLTRKWSKEQDPHRVPQHDLLRQRRLRHRVGGAHLLRRRPQPRGLRHDAASRTCAKELQPRPRPRCSPAIIASPERLRPRRAPGRGEAPAQHRAHEDARPGPHHARRVRRRASPQPLPSHAASRRRAVDTKRARTSPPGSASSSSTSSAPQTAFEGGLRITHDARPRPAEGRRAGGRQLPAPARRPDGVARRDRQQDRRGPRDGRRPRLRRRRRSTSPPRASASPARRSSRSSSPRRCARASAPGSVWPSRKRVFTCRARTARRSSSSTTSRATTRAARRSASALTFSDNSVFAAVGHPGRHQAGSPSWPSGWASARRSRPTRR